MMKRGEAQYVVGLVPSDLAGAALTGDWVSLKYFNHIEIVIVKGVGTGGEVPSFTFEQAQDVSGTGAKALNFTELQTKVGADLAAVGAPTLSTQVSGNTYAPAAGDTQVFAVVEFDAQHFDVNNGFDCVRGKANDVGDDPQLCAIIYRLSDPRYDPMTVSAIVD
jgi:hypothetical protein